MKKGQIHSKCKACGNTSIIDPKHKLSTFIMKNPPKVDEKDKKDGVNNGSADNSVIDGEIPSDKDLVNEFSQSLPNSNSINCLCNLSHFVMEIIVEWKCFGW